MVDVNRCVGCYTCEVACKQVYNEKRIILWDYGPVEIENQEKKLLSIPQATDSCDLCRNEEYGKNSPICVQACPTNALSVNSTKQLVRKIEGQKNRYQICTSLNLNSENDKD